MHADKRKLAEAGAGLLGGLVLLRLALKPVLIPVLNVHFSLSWLLLPVKLLVRLALWLGWNVTKMALITIMCNYVWKLIKLLHNIVTSKDKSKDVPHNCIPPEGWKHLELVQADTAALIRKHYPELSDLAAAGTLIAIQPRKMLVQALQQLQGGGPGEAQQLLQGSQVLDACLAASVPEIVFVVGTVHVAKQSAEDVTRVIKAIQPQLVVLELCAPRIKALLVDPYADPLTDLEPCPDKLAAAAAYKHKNVASVLRAALASRDHNVLSTIMTGLYQLLEEKLAVKAGLEFVAARRALIELQQEQEAPRSRRSSSPSTLLSLLKGDIKRSSNINSSANSAADAAVSKAAGSECSWSSSSSCSGADEDVTTSAAVPASNGKVWGGSQTTTAAAPAGADPAAAGAMGAGQFECVMVSERRQLLEQVQSATSWLQRCVAADRPVMDTLLGVWSALSPLRRIRFIVDIVSSLGSLVDEEMIASLGDEDMVEVLMKECSQEYPEIMKPLLHDRNWLLATTAWRAAQHTAQPGQPVLAIVGRGHMPGMMYVMQRLVQHVALLSIRDTAEEEAAMEQAAAAAAAAKAEAQAEAEARTSEMQMLPALPEAGLAVAAEQASTVTHY